MLFIGDGTVQVLEISLPNAAVRINSTRVVDLLFNGTNTTVNGTWGAGLPQGGNYFLAVDSSTNKMVVVGCSVQVNLQGGEDSSFISSCSTIYPSGPAVIAVVFTAVKQISLWATRFTTFTDHRPLVIIKFLST